MRVISSVQFGSDGSAVLHYMDTKADVRNRELLMMSHTIAVAPGEGGRDYAEEIDAVRLAAEVLLADALEDFNAPPEDIRE